MDGIEGFINKHTDKFGWFLHICTWECVEVATARMGLAQQIAHNIHDKKGIFNSQTI